MIFKLRGSIRPTHNRKSKFRDVDHLYNKVSNIVEEANSSHIINKRLELKVIHIRLLILKWEKNKLDMIDGSNLIYLIDLVIICE